VTIKISVFSDTQGL